MKRDTINMTSGPMLKNIISYTIPIILASILQLLFNAADLVVVGQYCGSVCVAAVGATGSLINLIVNLFIGLSIGTGVAVAHAMGSRQNAAVSRAVHTSLPVAIIGGAILTVVGITMSSTFLKLMGTPGKVLDLSTKYMRIYFCGILPCLVYNFCAAILRAAGDTKSPFVCLALSGLLNVALNLIFVKFFNMDVDGVALATAISQTVSAILVVTVLMKREDACKLRLKKLHIYKTEFLKILRVGLPAGIQSSVFSISNVIIQSSINSFGETVISGMAAGANLCGFIYVSMNAFYQTCINFVSQNKGAGNYDRIRKVLHSCLLCVSVTGIVMGGIFCLLSNQLLSFYISDSQAAIQFGVQHMLYVGMPYFIFGAMDVTVGAQRGIGSSVLPMIISITGICALRIIWIYTIFQIPQYHTLECLLLSYIISWVVTLISQYIAFLVIFNRKRRKFEELHPVNAL